MCACVCVYVCVCVCMFCVYVQTNEGTPGFTEWFEIQIEGGELLHSKKVWHVSLYVHVMCVCGCAVCMFVCLLLGLCCV